LLLGMFTKHYLFHPLRPKLGFGGWKSDANMRSSPPKYDPAKLYTYSNG
jgi:hypothetical protein